MNAVLKCPGAKNRIADWIVSSFLSTLMVIAINSDTTEVETEYSYLVEFNVKDCKKLEEDNI